MRKLSGISKRVMSGMLATAMVVSFAACGQSDKGGNSGNASGGEAVDKSDVKSTIYEASNLSYDGIEGSPTFMDVVGDDIVVCTVDSPSVDPSDENYDYLSNYKLYSVPKNGGSAELLTEYENSSDSLMQINKSNDNIGLLFWEISDDGSGEISAHRYDVIDNNGDVVKNINIDFAYEGKQHAPSDILYLDDEDAMIVCYDNEIDVTDSNGKEMFTLNCEEGHPSAVITKDNTPAALFDNNGNVIIKTIDIDDESYKDTYEGTASINSRPTSGFGNYDFVYLSKSEVCGYSLADNKEVVLCDYSASGISIEDSCCAVIDDKNIATATYDNGQTCLKSYTMIDPNDYEESKDLTLMCYDLPDSIKDLVNDFNETNGEYKIIINDYKNYEDSQTKMRLDILSGNTPDIYYLGDANESLSLKTSISKGLYEDLTPYIENDPDVSPDILIPSLYEAMKTDGKLFYLCSNFTMSALVGNKNLTGDRENLSINDLNEIMANLPDTHDVIDGNTKMDCFSFLIGWSITEFIDWETGECNFNCPEFKTILELCNRKKDLTDEELMENYDLMSGPEYENVLSTLHVYPDTLALRGGNISRVAFSSKSQGRVSAEIRGILAISSTSKHKDEAWEFVKQIISFDYQAKNYQYGMNGLYTNKQVYDLYMKTYTATAPYTDEFGNQVDNVSFSDSLSDADIERFNQEVNKINYIDSRDGSVFGIIYEEAESYFKGEKTADETAEIVQNRVQTYVMEQR